MNRQTETIRNMIFIALYAALAIVMDIVKQFIPFTSIWANGGSIDISLIPLVFASIHLGPLTGVMTGVMQFLISVIIGTTTLYFAPYNPILGFLCDYLIPTIIMGLSSFLLTKDSSRKSALIRLDIGIFVCMAIRIISQVLSGVYCWVDASELGSVAAWIFSLRYNLGYGLPTMIMLLLVMPVLYGIFEKRIRR